MFKFFSVSFFLVAFICVLGVFLFGFSINYFDCTMSLLGDLIVVDSISFYFSVLVFILGVYSQFVFVDDFSKIVRIFLFLSLFFSLTSFFVNHAILFWCFYELSMFPLLFLIFKESPYSERFLAGWYFSCYLVITSLPLILTLLYLGLINNSFLFSNWNLSVKSSWILVLLSFIFFTKVPLVPFHTWLPIVHAEATSIVSIFLSGYIMKLGILGVFRCCNSVFNNNVFLPYLLVILVVSIMFLITSCSELDGKRWLAFLSLSHIVVPFFAFFIGDWCLVNYSFFYCLGHGVSAGLVFGVLWYLYELSNSRNWILLKSSVGGKSIMLLLVFSFLSLCSFPPTIQFFCEVGLISISNSVLYMLFWFMYLFFGGLVPLVLCGFVLIRSEFFEALHSGSTKYYYFFVFLLNWCYLGFFLI